jgi:hypothetical protein
MFKGIAEIHPALQLRLNCDEYVSRFMEKLRSGERSRALRQDTAEMTFQVTSWLLANLVKSKVRGDRIIISLHKDKKYGDFSQRIVISTVHRMAELGEIDLVIGSLKDRRASTIAPLNIDLTGLTYRNEAKPKVIAKHKGKLVPIETYHSPEIREHQENQMLRIQGPINSANIAFKGIEWELEDKQLQRIFNPKEGLNEENSGENYLGFGRLYGAAWISCPKELRQYITIDGEHVALLDFNQMFLRLAFYIAKLIPPDHVDLYDLSKHLAGDDGSKQFRGALKQFISSMWFCTNQTMPNDIFFPCDEHLRPADKRMNKYVKNKTVKYDSVYNAFLRQYPELRKVAESRKIGYDMATLESEIMIEVSLRATEMGFVVLTIHDGLLVKQSRADAAGIVMDEVTLEKLGFLLPHGTEFLYPTLEKSVEEDMDFTVEELDESGYGPKADLDFNEFTVPKTG